MKILKNQIRELVRQSIFDEIEEGGPGSGKSKGQSMQDTQSDIEAQDTWKKKPPKKFKKNYPSHQADLEESAGRKRCTVKEIKTWFKTLEENRYKKTYNSDARRVSWLVNNKLSEDYEQMPISMRKKWSKAAYGRERFLAKEYIKHLKEIEIKRKVNESKLRNRIRSLIKDII